MHRAHSLPSAHEPGIVSPPLSPATSPAFEVPTVLVHPPEDEAMPLYASDASQENAGPGMVFTTPEMELRQSELDDWPQAVHPTAEHAPAFHRPQTDSAVIMPRRNATFHYSLSRNANPLLAPIPESPKRAKERDDDDIDEVMKVRRGEGMLDVAYAHGTVPTLRRSKTLRSRAVHALRSIKNVRKAPRRPPLEQVFLAKENEHTVKTEVPTQASSIANKHPAKAKVSPTSTQSSIPRLKRRVSQPLTNLFGLGGSESVLPSASDDIAFGVSPSHSSGFRSLPYSRSGASASSPALQRFTDEPARPTSPSFSLRGNRSKLSFVNLQSIFSGNMQPRPAEVSPDVDEPVPQTPVDDEWDLEEDYDSPRRRIDPGRVPRPSDESAYPEQDISFETRLNSFHFDSFSFDADAF